MGMMRPMSAAEQALLGPEPKDERLEIPLAELDLCVRTVNLLEREGLFTVGDVLAMPRSRLAGIRDCGPRVQVELFAALAKIGFVEAKGRR